MAVTKLDNFIKNFKKSDPDKITELFLEYHCYYFALILQSRIPESDIVYDIYDEDDLDDLVLWDEMENIDKIEYDQLMDSCINLE